MEKTGRKPGRHMGESDECRNEPSPPADQNAEPIRQIGPLGRKCLWAAIGVLILYMAVPPLLHGIFRVPIGILPEPMNINFTRLEALAQEPEMEFDYMEVSQTYLDSLDAEAFYRNPDKMAQAYPDRTQDQKNAMKWLPDALKRRPYSRRECIAQLKVNGFTEEEAGTYTDWCRIDFKIQALKAGLLLLESGGYGPAQLEQELQKKGYTREEAEYARDHCGADWYHQTELAVKESLYYGSSSRAFIEDSLQKDGHDPQAIRKVIESLNPDWNREALQEAIDTYASLSRLYPVDREILHRQLALWDFEPEQIQYALDLVLPES